MTTELQPIYDSRASFYGKARVEQEHEYEIKLISYTTHVASIVTVGSVAEAHVFGTYSQTTLRHIKEFLRQNGFWVDTAKEIAANYMVKNQDQNKRN